jgi:hypothetical protein
MKGITMKKLATLILATLLLAGCAKKPVTTTVPPAPSIEPTVATVLPDCPGLPPVCAGGLLPQTATADQINAYEKKYSLTVPLSCRFMQPPLCYQGETPKCAQQCTPSLLVAAISEGATGGHSVTLSCSDTTLGVSFNFYKASTSGGESAAALNASPLASCSYTDTAVTALQTYYYTAKAYLATASPSLSNPSNEVQAVIPADSQPAAPVLNAPTVAGNQVDLNWTIAQQAGVTVNSTAVFRCTNLGCPAPPKIATVTYPALSYVDTPPCSSRKPCTWHWETKANDLVNGKKVTTGPSNIVTATVP